MCFHILGGVHTCMLYPANQWQCMDQRGSTSFDNRETNPGVIQDSMDQHLRAWRSYVLRFIHHIYNDQLKNIHHISSKSQSQISWALSLCCTVHKASFLRLSEAKTPSLFERNNSKRFQYFLHFTLRRLLRIVEILTNLSRSSFSPSQRPNVWFEHVLTFIFSEKATGSPIFGEWINHQSLPKHVPHLLQPMVVVGCI